MIKNTIGSMEKLHLFFEERPDKWFKGENELIYLLKRALGRESKWKIKGQTRVFLNLVEGLKKAKIAFDVNNYKYCLSHPDVPICILGNTDMLLKHEWKNPIILGPCIFSHPVDFPDLLTRYDIKKVIVPSDWIKNMYTQHYGNICEAWPVGINVEKWKPVKSKKEPFDILLYQKLYWEDNTVANSLFNNIKAYLEEKKVAYKVLVRGNYSSKEYYDLLNNSKALIFLSWHETQGIAYQEALACGVPVLAYDKGGFWQDPNYYPEKVMFQPVSSVPYWSSQCGMKFKTLDEFEKVFPLFVSKVNQGLFSPREYVKNNLSLTVSTALYVKIVQDVFDELNKRIPHL